MSIFKRPTAAALTMCALLECSASLLAADNRPRPLQLRVSPRVASAPAVLNIYVSIAQDEANRLLRVTAESPDFFQSSERQLDGGQSVRVAVFVFRDIPPGNYEVKAELVVVKGRTAEVVKVEVNVV